MVSAADANHKQDSTAVTLIGRMVSKAGEDRKLRFEHAGRVIEIPQDDGSWVVDWADVCVSGWLLKKDETDERQSQEHRTK